MMPRGACSSLLLCKRVSCTWVVLMMTTHWSGGSVEINNDNDTDNTHDGHRADDADTRSGSGIVDDNNNTQTHGSGSVNNNDNNTWQ